LNTVLFETVDREDDVLMNRILRNAPTIAGRRGGYDLVVHTAGPFQGKVNRPNGIMKACIDNGVGYIDVCDDYCTACAARGKYASVAMERGVPCIVSTGCWPGVSSLMAKQLTRSVLEAKPHLKANDLTVDFSFFTAGSGGAGATLLVATFLILAEKSLVIVNGRRRSVPAMKEYSKVDFGDVVGEKDVGHLNLLEAASW
jgi:saccharopine dehydrogenase-like NADP-dependent oxidoreductase